MIPGVKKPKKLFGVVNVPWFLTVFVSEVA